MITRPFRSWSHSFREDAETRRVVVRYCRAIVADIEQKMLASAETSFFQDGEWKDVTIPWTAFN